jgi:DNA repair exonuclease SbcCD ATPase subunit
LDAQQVVKYFLKEDQASQLLAEITRIQEELTSSEENAVELQVLLDEARQQRAKAVQDGERMQSELTEALSAQEEHHASSEELQESHSRCAELEKHLAQEKNAAERLHKQQDTLKEQLHETESRLELQEVASLSGTDALQLQLDAATRELYELRATQEAEVGKWTSAA